MKFIQVLATLLLFATALPFVSAGGDEDHDEDDDGLFYFQDSNDWSNSAIYPQSCVEQNGAASVVYQLYNKGHNQCKRKSMGTYKLDLETFIRGYSKQMKQEYEAKGQDYEVDNDAMAYLECQEYYYNNNRLYMKVGCRSTGKGFQMHAYTDAYCTTKASMNYNLGGIDISGLRVNFEVCKSCVASNGYNNYNNNNNGNGNNYYGYQNLFEHDSELCSVANHYKQTCNRSCRRQARRSSSSSRSSSGEGFSTVGKFFLWVLSISAIFFLLAGLAQRKKMSKQDALIEEAAIKSSGVDKKFIPRIFIGLILFIIFLILFKRKTLTWFFLIALNIALLGYWMHLKNKAEQNAAVSGFQLYGDGGGTAA